MYQQKLPKTKKAKTKQNKKNKNQKQKPLRKITECPRTLGKPQKLKGTHDKGTRRKIKKRKEKILGAIIQDNFPKLMLGSTSQVQQNQKTQNRINTQLNPKPYRQASQAGILETWIRNNNNKKESLKENTEKTTPYFSSETLQAKNEQSILYPEKLFFAMREIQSLLRRWQSREPENCVSTQPTAWQNVSGSTMSE